MKTCQNQFINRSIWYCELANWLASNRNDEDHNDSNNSESPSQALSIRFDLGKVFAREKESEFVLFEQRRSNIRKKAYTVTDNR